MTVDYERKVPVYCLSIAHIQNVNLIEVLFVVFWGFF